MVKLAAFQATFHESIILMSPVMAPLIMDTGASISISPFITDFISPIRPAQHITIKGIASGLNVAGMGNLAYTFLNDNGVEQTITLKNSLYVPQSAVRLVCPWQIGTITGHQEDGLYAQHSACKLIVEGQVTTLKYDTLSQLPVLFTTPGITSYLTFANTMCAPTESNSIAFLTPGNLTKKQHPKLYLHDLSTHEGFRNLNTWIKKGLFPGVDPKLALESDPI
jgi:hypothetical protein